CWFTIRSCVGSDLKKEWNIWQSEPCCPPSGISRQSALEFLCGSCLPEWSLKNLLGVWTSATLQMFSPLKKLFRSCVAGRKAKPNVYSTSWIMDIQGIPQLQDGSVIAMKRWFHSLCLNQLKKGST